MARSSCYHASGALLRRNRSSLGDLICTLNSLVIFLSLMFIQVDRSSSISYAKRRDAAKFGHYIRSKLAAFGVGESDLAETIVNPSVAG